MLSSQQRAPQSEQSEPKAQPYGVSIHLGKNAMSLQEPDEGRGDAGRGDEGRGDEGCGDEGCGDEGRGDEGRGDEGCGDEACGGQGVVVATPFSASSTHESSQSGATPLLQVKMVGNGTRPAATAASAAALAVAPHTARRVLSWGTCEGPRACTSPRIHACACVHTMHAESWVGAVSTGDDPGPSVVIAMLPFKSISLDHESECGHEQTQCINKREEESNCLTTLPEYQEDKRAWLCARLRYNLPLNS